MPGADGEGTVKAFCPQRLVGKAPLLAMKRGKNKAFPGNDCKGKGLSPAMVAKAKGSPRQGLQRQTALWGNDCKGKRLCVASLQRQKREQIDLCRNALSFNLRGGFYHSGDFFRKADLNAFFN